MLLPVQIPIFGLTFTGGSGFTVTDTVSVAEQLLLLVTVTTYVNTTGAGPALVSETVGVADVVELNPVAGVHK